MMEVMWIGVIISFLLPELLDRICLCLERRSENDHINERS